MRSGGFPARSWQEPGERGGGLSGPAIHPVAVRVVHDVHRAHPGLPIVGVPKTIDNDLSGTDVTFGFDTAVQIVCGPYPDENMMESRWENEGGMPYTKKDFSVVNPRYFDFADRRIRHLVEAGIVPVIVGGWGRPQGGAQTGTAVHGDLQGQLRPEGEQGAHHFDIDRVVFHVQNPHDVLTAWQVEKEEPQSKSFSLLLQNFQQIVG